nr:hypothetical protein [Tanacetum cinerariifolium]
VAQSTYASGLNAANSTLYFYNAGNKFLKWETSKKTDIGLSFGLLQDRLTGNFAYYRNNVDGLILNVPTSPSRGIPNPDVANSIQANVGSMLNNGVELDLRFNAIQGVNPANGRRLIQKANGTVAQFDLTAGWTTVNADGTNGAATTAPNQLTDGVYYGPVLPTWYGGFDNTFRFKNFDLGVFIQFSGGNYIYNGTKAGLHDQRFWNNSTDILERWTTPGQNAKYPRVVYGDNVSNGSALIMSSNVEKGDFA